MQVLCSLHVYPSRFAPLPHVAYNILFLSLDSSPAEVAAFLDAEGFAPQPFLGQHISGTCLSKLSSRDLVSTGLCHLFADALRILGRAQLSFAPFRPPLATVLTQEMCPVSLCECLQQHGLLLFAHTFIDQPICGYGFFMMNKGDIVAMACVSDHNAMHIFFR